MILGSPPRIRKSRGLGETRAEAGGATWVCNGQVMDPITKNAFINRKYPQYLYPYGPPPNVCEPFYETVIVPQTAPAPAPLPVYVTQTVTQTPTQTQASAQIPTIDSYDPKNTGADSASIMESVAAMFAALKPSPTYYAPQPSYVPPPPILPASGSMVGSPIDVIAGQPGATNVTLNQSNAATDFFAKNKWWLVGAVAVLGATFLYAKKGRRK